MYPEQFNEPISVSPRRRQVLKAAAWAVPAITVASAAPAFATSSAVQLPLSVTSYWHQGLAISSSGSAGNIVRRINPLNNLQIGFDVVDEEFNAVETGTYITSVVLTIEWDADVVLTISDVSYAGWSIASGEFADSKKGIVTLTPTTPLVNGEYVQVPKVTFRHKDAVPGTSFIQISVNGLNVEGNQPGGAFQGSRPAPE